MIAKIYVVIKYLDWRFRKKIEIILTHLLKVNY